MSDAYLGEIRLFPFDWAPVGWLPCDGRELEIVQYAALYALLGKQFGGNSQTKFNLPDLRGRTTVGMGTNPTDPKSEFYAVGNAGGEDAVALTLAQIPPHTHQLMGTSEQGTTAAPSGNYFAQTPTNHRLYDVPTADVAVALTSDTVGNTGASDVHNNMQPSLVLSYCICTQGEYPQRG